MKSKELFSGHSLIMRSLYLSFISNYYVTQKSQNNYMSNKETTDDLMPSIISSFVIRPEYIGYGAELLVKEAYQVADMTALQNGDQR